MKKLVVCDSLGCRVSEETARMLDTLVKTLPSDQLYRTPRYMTKAAVMEESREDQRTDVAVITTDAVDLDNEIVDPAGIDMDYYAKTMVVLWNHDPGDPVGRCLWIRKVPHGIKAATQYAERPNDWPEGETWTPERVWQLVKAGIVVGKSIGFLPVEIREPTAEEKSADAKVERVVTKCVLLEYSTVSSPCNPGALITEAKSLSNVIGFTNVGRPTRRKVQPKPAKPVDFGPLASALDVCEFDSERIAALVVERLATLGRV